MYKIKFLIITFLILNSCKQMEDNSVELFFKDITNVEIYAYNNRTHWKIEDNVDFRSFKNFKNNQVFIKDIYIKNKISLSTEQIKELKNSFKKEYNDDSVSACYNPRHLLVFYNGKNNIKGYIEVCFECTNLDASKNTRKFAKNIFLMKDLIKKLGISYFDDSE